MTEAETESFYRRYIGCLNEHRPGELGEFVHDELTYNGEHMARRAYEDMIAANFAAIPDLYFDVHLLVAGHGQIGCRLRFDCTPSGEFLGIPPSGKRISFCEHVFYRLNDGRITEVWSLLDQAAIEKQLTS